MYAVRFHEFTGQVIGASDELEHDDIGSALLNGFDDCDGNASWINSESGDFDLYAYIHNGEIVTDTIPFPAGGLNDN